jgi:hypothetical protein
VADRALLLFAFQMLFGLIAVAAVGMLGLAAVRLLRTAPTDPAPVIAFVVLLVLVAIAVHGLRVFRTLEDPQPTVAKLRARLCELEGDDQTPRNQATTKRAAPDGTVDAHKPTDIPKGSR